MWKSEIDFDINLINQEWRVYLDRRELGDFQIARAVWIGDYVEPSTFLDLWKSDSVNNWISWHNQEYDRLMSLAEAELDRNRRYHYYAEAETILLNDYAIIPIYHYVTAYLIRPELKGWKPNLLDWHPYKYLRLGD